MMVQWSADRKLEVVWPDFTRRPNPGSGRRRIPNLRGAVQIMIRLD